MKFLNRLRSFRKSLSDYRPSVEVLIFKDNLKHNLNEYRRQYPGLAFSPVLKSNAYGHGLVEVAEILDGEDIPFLTVDSLYEAMTLRGSGIRSRILVIGYSDVHNIRNSRLSNVSFAITSLSQLREIAQKLSRTKQFHLKIDTGMHRQGILSTQIDEVISLVKGNKHLRLEGICSHFADADGEDQAFTKAQIGQWKSIVEIFKAKFKTIQYYHLANTAGTFYFDPALSNVARLGIGLYGINSSPFAKLDLRPALQMESVISSVRDISPGEPVGYNGAYVAKKNIRIASVPVGYYEGVDRRLSNCGYFKLGDTECPIVGRVSMNITSIDMSYVPAARRGDRVVAISAQPHDLNSIERIAALCKTIPYEILVHIPRHLRRTVV